jgi:hypothetical protein
MRDHPLVGLQKVDPPWLGRRSNCIHPDQEYGILPVDLARDRDCRKRVRRTLSIVREGSREVHCGGRVKAIIACGLTPEVYCQITIPE